MLIYVPHNTYFKYITVNICIHTQIWYISRENTEKLRGLRTSGFPRILPAHDVGMVDFTRLKIR